MTVPALEALERLRQGNRRFVAGRPGDFDGRDRREAFTSAQAPFAVILGCSDSRVPVELVFDQGFGDLFVIRVAGNIVAPSQIGSVEFAADRFGTRLVVVLGHTHCGAVQATLEHLQRPEGSGSRHLGSIVDRIRPAVEGLRGTEHGGDALMQRAVRENVRAAVGRLRRGSAVLRELMRNDGLLVIGAEYSLETGAVDFFHGLPAPADEEAPAARPDCA